MSRLFYHTMQDNTGNLLFDVSGTMRIAGSGTLATIYGDEALTVILPNPMTNHPSYGSFKCFLGAGDYDFYLAKSGYTFETLTGVQGHGTMAQQDASAVVITGGSVSGLSAFSVDGAFHAYTTAQVDGTTQLLGYVGLGGASTVGNRGTVHYDKPTVSGLKFQPYLSDTGAGRALQFNNIGATEVGSIITNATTTAYTTTSDARLKHAITPLTGALDVVRALNPVSYLWRSDDSPGVGFVAHEVAEIVDGVVTGEKDAVDADGQIMPQQMDLSKLVPWLVSACQDLAQQVQALTARLDAASG